MKPGTLERRQEPARGRKHPSPRKRETRPARDGGFTGVADEELEFFDTVGVDPREAADAFSVAGVRVRH
jgi:hypothetical protein